MSLFQSLSQSGRRVPLKRFGLLGVTAGALFGLLVAVMFLGYQVAVREFFPYTLFDRVNAKIEWEFFRTSEAMRLEDQTIPTALLQVETNVDVVETGRTARGPILQNGGGLTSFGSDVLLLPYNGRIYAANGDGAPRATGVAAPDNNRAEYEALAENPEFEEYRIGAGYLRYNDLEYVQTENGHALIASYTEYHPDEICYTNTLARLDLDPETRTIDGVIAGPDDWTIVYRTEPCLSLKDRYLAIEGHLASGRLAFDLETGTLYLSSGDFHLDGMRSEGPPIAQNPDAEYGKIIAMRPDGSEASIVSTGHRNVQGLVRAPDGRLFVAEHGPKGGDEVNIVRPDNNYGWPLESYGISYSSTPIPGSLSVGRHETYTRPIHSWVPSVATSGLAMVEGFHPNWDGDLLVASLIDNSLYRLRLANNDAIYSERVEIGTRLRDVHQHTDGRLVIWTDNAELIFLTAKDLPDRALTVERFARMEDLGTRQASRLETEISGCAQCHSLLADEHTNAPSLARIFGDEIASTPFEGYSDALASKNGTWTAETMTEYLVDPQGFAPGTQMPGVEDPEMADLVVEYLEELDNAF